MEFGRNKFAFIFPIVLDKKRILEDGPWSINGDHLVLKKVPLNLAFNEVDFSTTTFCVRILGLPRYLIFYDSAKRIASRIGRVVEVDK